MRGNDLTRRSVLVASAGLATGATAGCLDSLPVVGNGSPTYGRYMRSSGDLWNAPFDYTVVRPAALSDHRPAMPDRFRVDREPYVPVERRSRTTAFGVEFTGLDAVVGVGRNRDDRFTSHVLLGGYDRSALEERLTGWDFSAHATYEGYDIWARNVPDFQPSAGEQGRFSTEEVTEGQAVAMGEDVLVTGAVREYTQVTNVERTIDAIEGDAERYADANERGAELLDHLDRGQFRVGNTWFEPASPATVEKNPGHFAGEVASGAALTVGGESTQVRTARVLDSSDDVDMDAAREWRDSLPTVSYYLDGDDEAERPYRNFEGEVRQDGRVVVLEGSMPTADLTLQLP